MVAVIGRMDESAWFCVSASEALGVSYWHCCRQYRASSTPLEAPAEVSLGTSGCYSSEHTSQWIDTISKGDSSKAVHPPLLSVFALAHGFLHLYRHADTGKGARSVGICVEGL